MGMYAPRRLCRVQAPDCYPFGNSCCPTLCRAAVKGIVIRLIHRNIHKLLGRIRRWVMGCAMRRRSRSLSPVANAHASLQITNRIVDPCVQRSTREHSWRKHACKRAVHAT